MKKFNLLILLPPLLKSTMMKGNWNFAGVERDINNRKQKCKKNHHLNCMT